MASPDDYYDDHSRQPLTFADSVVGRASIFAIVGLGGAFILLALGMMFS